MTAAAETYSLRIKCYKQLLNCKLSKRIVAVENFTDCLWNVLQLTNLMLLLTPTTNLSLKMKTVTLVQMLQAILLLAPSLTRN